MNIKNIIDCAQNLLTGDVSFNCVNYQLCYESRRSEEQRIGAVTRAWLWEHWRKACKQPSVRPQHFQGEETAGIAPKDFPQPERVYGPPPSPDCAGIFLVGLKDTNDLRGEPNDR